MKFYQLTNKSFTEEGVSTYKELWDKVKGTHKGFCACLDTEFKKSKDNDNRFHVVMSTATEDRHGDIVEQNWDLKAFKKNPVFLDSHNYNSIEHILGKVHNAKVKDGKLVGDIEFMLDNPKGLLAYKMASGGFLNATSVGFIPLEFDKYGKIIKSELLEDSAVSVPANSEALFGKTAKKQINEEEDTEKPEGTGDDEVSEDTKVSEVDEQTTTGEGEGDERGQEEDTESEGTGGENETDPSDEGGDEKGETGEGEEKSIEKISPIKAWARKENERRKELLGESLAVIQQLANSEQSAEERKRMVNRVVRQLLKAKD